MDKYISKKSKPCKSRQKQKSVSKKTEGRKSTKKSIPRSNHPPLPLVNITKIAEERKKTIKLQLKDTIAREIDDKVPPLPVNATPKGPMFQIIKRKQVELTGKSSTQ